MKRQERWLFTVDSDVILRHKDCWLRHFAYLQAQIWIDDGILFQLTIPELILRMSFRGPFNHWSRIHTGGCRNHLLP